MPGLGSMIQGQQPSAQLYTWQRSAVSQLTNSACEISSCFSRICDQPPCWIVPVCHGLLDSITVVFAVLVMIGVILGLGHGCGCGFSSGSEVPCTNGTEINPH